ADVRRFVVLALLELGEEPGLLALLLEALEGARDGLVGLDDDLGHADPSPCRPTDLRGINDNYIPCDGGSGKRPPARRCPRSDTAAGPAPGRITADPRPPGRRPSRAPGPRPPGRLPRWVAAPPACSPSARGPCPGPCAVVGRCP